MIFRGDCSIEKYRQCWKSRQSINIILMITIIELCFQSKLKMEETVIEKALKMKKELPKKNSLGRKNLKKSKNSV